ncbi:uncharacterized protein FIBRA_02698 [Fibroporia radiculosa]|uniref:Mid2 domain-containing protein n=1 Tax=Fibroporia radiculosa TaxID=599839 RepID=J4GN19_9APHY|nr:uncharacterized protein FIBRA_02698 [Fibroporia radiculosa]CCM00660.1 predicted protein [Fibroporia radiculosa]
MSASGGNNVVLVSVTSSDLSLDNSWNFLSSGSETVAIATSAASGSLKFSGGFCSSDLSELQSRALQHAGTQVGVYGLLAPQQPVMSTYSIDGSTPYTYTTPADGSNGTSQTSFGFFVSPELNAGEHTLVFNATNATATAAFTVQYLLYVTSVKPTGSGVSMTSGSLGPQSTTIIVTESGGSSTPVGPIVGGVVGGVAGLVIFALLGYFLYMRRRRGQAYFYQSAAVKDMLDNEGKPIVEPYPIQAIVAPSFPQPSGHMPKGSVTNMSPPSEIGQSSTYRPQSIHASSSAAGSSSGSRPSLTLHMASVPVFSSPNQANSKAAEAGLLSIAQPTNYHSDSGMRFGASGEPSSSSRPAHDVPVDVPPSYSEN